MSHAAQPHFKSQLILPTSNSNFELYFSGPVLAIYMMKPLQILTHQISTNLNHFEFQSTKNILCLMIRVNKVFDTTPNLNYSQSLLQPLTTTPTPLESMKLHKCNCSLKFDAKVLGQSKGKLETASQD